MNRRAFRIGSWLALTAVVVSALLTVVTGVTGVQALTGKATYPVERSLGPFTFRDTLSVEAVTSSPVCQTWSIDLLPNEYPGDGSFCYKLQQDAQQPQNLRDGVLYQDQDVRPTDVVLSGEVLLATDGSWNPWVAAQVVKQVIVWSTVTVWFLLLWGLLAAAAAGNPLSTRTVRLAQGLGWLTISAALLAPALDHFTGINEVGAVGGSQRGEPFLDLVGTWGYPGGVDFVQVALGALVLLVAEVFRHGAMIETERRLTV